jgi:phage tail sheath protein FI
VLDAGLSTIFASTYGVSVNNTPVSAFNDEIFLNTSNDSVLRLAQESWKSVVIPLVNFAENSRKDCMSIIDPPRYLFVKGKDGKVIDSEETNFTQGIFAPLKEIVSIDSNYCAIYANWIKLYDGFSGRKFWSPFSGYAAAVYARNDAVAQPWSAPAGLNRGTFDALDIAINPNQKQRDRFYEISVNPVSFFTGDGYVVMGQKTLQVKPTAFDRVNVRRLFLTLERSVARTLKYFVFEPNTEFTRTRLVNTIVPIFEFAKNTQGLYDYLIVSDSRNNTPETIDNNELIVDIYLKPVRTAEFILVNFIATRTGQNFAELI